MAKKAGKPGNAKQADLSKDTVSPEETFLTTNQGVRVNDNQNTLKAGERGPSLLEDFIFREKIFHFDHERIPERVVHARGAGAHGYFQPYQSLAEHTKAGFLQDMGKSTPVFVRFSTVAGSKGSTDLARDVRGFAVKFYTEEGIFDLVGNNIPVFFIQDAIKFPDLIHAVKPEPHNEIPQAASAHDTFWDFVSLMPESMHMIQWAMSDRAIPRSYRMMEGFGVHTFRLVNAKGKSTFVKFHWKPKLGVHAVAWDEAQKISGMDPDFHRRDLWDAIESGAFPEWELGVQLVDEKDEHKFPFDLLDPTKIIPEELVPVQRIGRMVLNRNPENFFAETEQVAFHPGHVVPGIDFTNDPLLQGRLFSYTDTQLSRLGSPNFHEIPINRPVAPVHNNQRDGHMRQAINRGTASYQPNSLGGGCPYQAMMSQGGFSSYPEQIDARKVRDRSASFADHFSQATLFFNSQSAAEQQHIIDAFSFELGKVNYPHIREKVLGLLTQVDRSLARAVAANLGMEVPKSPEKPVNHGVPADADQRKYEPKKVKPVIASSGALSMANTPKDTIATRKVAFLVADGMDAKSLTALKSALLAAGATVEVVAPKLGVVKVADGKPVTVDKSFLTTASVLYDAVYVPGGVAGAERLAAEPDAIHFLNEAYRHCKPIGFDSTAKPLLGRTFLDVSQSGMGVVAGDGADSAFIKQFMHAIAQHRFWDREQARKVPA